MNVGVSEGTSVRAHAVEHELMQAIACPRIVAAKRLEDDQGPLELAGKRSSVLEREVVTPPPRSGHPVDDEVARSPNRLVVEKPNAGRWNAGQVMILSSPPSPEPRAPSPEPRAPTAQPPPMHLTPTGTCVTIYPD